MKILKTTITTAQDMMMNALSDIGGVLSGDGYGLDAYDIAFAPRGFGGSANYMSPKMIESFKNLNPASGLRAIGYTPYDDDNWRELTIGFEDWNDITIKISKFEKTSENTVVFHFGEYVTEGWAADYTEEEVNAMMGSEAGKLLYDILFSEKGWTIVPAYLAEYGDTNYIVSNEDPEMYMHFN